MCRPLLYASVISWRWYTLFLLIHSFSAELSTENAFPSICLWYLQDYSESARDPSSFENCTIILLLFQLVSVSKLLPPLLVSINCVLFHTLYYVSIYLDKILHLVTAACGSVLFHPNHDQFSCFSCFSRLVSSWMVTLLVILRYVTSLALVYITYPYARTYIFSSKTTCTINGMRILHNNIRINNNELYMERCCFYPYSTCPVIEKYFQ